MTSIKLSTPAFETEKLSKAKENKLLLLGNL